MKEYTLAALISVVLALMGDEASKVRITRKKEFYLLLCAMALFMLIVNGYITHQDIVVYARNLKSGLALGSIPAEDFLFGFSMVTSTIIFWELFKKH